ncbi:hypothetical protein C8R42DRAFT_722778 [Lentinula raphanica]|nr:hypothetical protein C8R42DRAFT_722778 [Lentinula raphanica]
MIIPDDTPLSPAKSNAALPNTISQSSLLESPPPYYGAALGRSLSLQEQQPYQPRIASSSSAIPNESTSPILMNSPRDLEANEPRNRRESPAKRFCKAFAVALLIYMLAAIFLGSFSHKMSSYQKKTSWHGEFPIPNDIVVNSCIRGSQMQNSSIGDWDQSYGTADFPLDSSIGFSSEHSAEPLVVQSSNGFGYGSVQTSFSLPLSSKNLFLISRGPTSSGNSLRIESSSDLEEGTARVDVRISYAEFAQRDFSLLTGVGVCLVHKKQGKGNQVGVGLFTSRDVPSSTYPRPQLAYDVTLVLPEARGPSLLRLDAFETDLHNFHHFFKQSLDEIVTFDKLTLKAGNGIIIAPSLTAGIATIHTSNREINIRSLTSKSASLYTINSEIRGHYTISQSLDVKAVNTKVKVDVEVYPQYPNSGAVITAQTTQKALEVIVNFHDPSHSFRLPNSSAPLISPSVLPSNFTISTNNKNGVVDVSIPMLPSDSALSLKASTTNGRLTTTLPATYEGSYALTTTNIAGEVRMEHTEDPEGLERRRAWNQESNKGNNLRGLVYWDESNRNKSAVVLKSVNGQAELFL